MENDAAAATKKVYTVTAIALGTFMGGPLATGYLMAANYKTFGEPAKARKTWLWAIIATVLVMAIAILLPDLPADSNYLFPLLYTVVAHMLAKSVQGKQVGAFLAEGGRKYSNWRAAGIGLIGALIIAVFVIGYAFLHGDFNAPTEIQYKTYGVLHNEIDFEKGNLSAAESDTIAEALTNAGFFSDEVKTMVFARKVNQSYELFIVLKGNYAKVKSVQDEYDVLRKDLQEQIPEHKIVINLCHDNEESVVKRLQ